MQSKENKQFECMVVDNNRFKITCINSNKESEMCITTYMKQKNQIWEDWLEKYIAACYILNTDMIDTGANIGTFSLMSSKYLSKNAIIHSFEPVFSNMLSHNINQNNLSDKIKVYPIGLSYRTENLEGEDGRELKENETKCIITVDKLDTFNFDNVSIIKIDKNGIERRILEGAYGTILWNTPSILIEIPCTSKNAIEKSQKSSTQIKSKFECFEFLFNLGYICFPVSAQSDDFLFVHHKKRHIIDKVMDIL